MLWTQPCCHQEDGQEITVFSKNQPMKPYDLGCYNDADFTVEETTGSERLRPLPKVTSKQQRRIYPRLGGSRGSWLEVVGVWTTCVASLSPPSPRRPLRCDLRLWAELELTQKMLQLRVVSHWSQWWWLVGGSVIAEGWGSAGKASEGRVRGKAECGLRPPTPSWAPPAWALPTPGADGRGFRGWGGSAVREVPALSFLGTGGQGELWGRLA